MAAGCIGGDTACLLPVRDEDGPRSGRRLGAGAGVALAATVVAFSVRELSQLAGGAARAGVDASTGFSAGPWVCHNYEGDQGDEWCKNVGVAGGFQYSFFGPNGPCGGCWCCKRQAIPDNPALAGMQWLHHTFEPGQDSRWCRNVGVQGSIEYRWFGDKNRGACAKRSLPQPNVPGEAGVWIDHTFLWYQGDWWCKKIGVADDGLEYRWFNVGAGEASPCALPCCKRYPAASIVPPPPIVPQPSGSGGPARRASFIVLGDWGFSGRFHGHNGLASCTNLVAQKMQETMQTLGDVRFIINVGDSFYPYGLRSKLDTQWDRKWRQVFAPEVRAVPWYSVYGNHDYLLDPGACTVDDLSLYAQINPDENDLNYFVMPNYTYFKEFPDLDLEIVMMDLNHYMKGWNHDLTVEQMSFIMCNYTLCEQACLRNAAIKARASAQLFHERLAASTARNLIVVSHYPTDYFVRTAPTFLDALRTARQKIVYFGGHRHSVDKWSTESIAPQESWLSGGGGGWGCDTPTQGFVVAEVLEDYSVRTYPVYVDFSGCCTGPN